MKNTLEISIKGFENYLIQKANLQIVNLIHTSQFFAKSLEPQNHNVALNFSSASLKLREKSSFKYGTNILSLPKKLQRFTVIRSPHIDKKGRDQFQLCTHKSIIQIRNIIKVPEYSFLFIFLENLKNTKFSGIQMQIKIHSKTFGPNSF